MVFKKNYVKINVKICKHTLCGRSASAYKKKLAIKMFCQIMRARSFDTCWMRSNIFIAVFKENKF